MKDAPREKIEKADQEVIGLETIASGGAGASEEFTDSELIRQVLSGGKDRYRLLVIRHRDLVFAMVMRQVGNRETAEELTQDTLIKAYFNLKRFRFDAAFSTWLTRIALNTTSSYFRSKRYRQQLRSESFVNERHQTTVNGPDEERERKEMFAAFRSALGELKPGYREVLVLCGLEGKSYEETAEILGIPVGTVRSRLNKARLLLKDAFTNRWLKECTQ